LLPALFVVACGSHATEPFPVEATPVPVADQAGSNKINPVFIVRKEEQGTISLEFPCGEEPDCYPLVTLPDQFDWLSVAFLDPDGALRIPVRTVELDTANRLGYLLITRTGNKLVTTSSLEGFKWPDQLADLVFIENEMIFLIESDDRIYLLKEDGSLENIPLGEPEPFANFHFKKGDGKSLIAFATLPRNESGHAWVDVRLVDLRSGKVETKMVSGPAITILPVGSTGHDPGKKYNVSFDGVSNDLQLAYFRYIGLNDRMHAVQQFSVHDSISGVDRGNLLINSRGSVLFKEYKGFLYQNGHATVGESLGMSAYILHIPDLAPLIDLQRKDVKSSVTRVVPFGDGFLVGLDTKILAVDLHGRVVEIALPEKIANSQYILAQYQEE
jgi:hypothetical protein